MKLLMRQKHKALHMPFVAFLLLFTMSCTTLFANLTPTIATAHTGVHIGGGGHVQRIGDTGEFIHQWGSNYDDIIIGTVGQSKRLEAFRLWSNVCGVYYQSHCQTYGWLDMAANNGWSGTFGQSKRIEAVKIWTNSSRYRIKYRVHMQGIGWGNWHGNGEMAGTTGQRRRVEALEVRLTDIR